MIRLALAVMAAMALLSACASTETAPATVPTAVRESACDGSKIPPRPAFPADSLTGSEDIFILATTLWADIRARIAYELSLETFYRECSKRPE